ncbi:phage tail protein [Achromobacter sp. UMC71]|uniref:phage tail protein n=1 Tax=Achromobacter sp. UMC71 TaxID=1862320 RepID=UPI0021035B23|nr:phage tail protein [Achromobacter sp. UMC71]
MFVFSLPTVAYQSLRRQTDWRHASNARMGAAPAYQYVGPGDDTITLSGWVAPELIGSTGSLELLRRMAETGKAYMLVDGSGTVYGAYVLLDIGEDQSLFYVTGQARRVEFTINLRRVDASRARTLLGDLQLPIGIMDGSVADWGLS